MKYAVLSILLLASVFASAQTTTYHASTGHVSSLNAVTGYLDGGGSFYSPGAMGTNCYYGQCPDWQFANYTLNYSLPDGSTAHLTNFSGSANFSTTQVPVQGTASGVDSEGRQVSVSVSWLWTAYCRSGRGGGCTKVFNTGTLTVEVGQ
jgi:hypothetical protein